MEMQSFRQTDRQSDPEAEPHATQRGTEDGRTEGDSTLPPVLTVSDSDQATQDREQQIFPLLRPLSRSGPRSLPSILFPSLDACIVSLCYTMRMSIPLLLHWAADFYVKAARPKASEVEAESVWAALRVSWPRSGQERGSRHH